MHISVALLCFQMEKSSESRCSSTLLSLNASPYTPHDRVCGRQIYRYHINFDILVGHITKCLRRLSQRCDTLLRLTRRTVKRQNTTDHFCSTELSKCWSAHLDDESLQMLIKANIKDRVCRMFGNYQHSWICSRCSSSMFRSVEGHMSVIWTSSRIRIQIIPADLIL